MNYRSVFIAVLVLSLPIAATVAQDDERLALERTCQGYVEINLLEDAEDCYRNLLTKPDYQESAQRGLDSLAERYAERAVLSLNKAEQELTMITNAFDLTRTAQDSARHYLSKLNALQPKHQQGTVLQSRLAELEQRMKAAVEDNSAEMQRLHKALKTAQIENQRLQTDVDAMLDLLEHTLVALDEQKAASPEQPAPAEASQQGSQAEVTGLESKLRKAQDDIEARDAEISRLQQGEMELEAMLRKAQDDLEAHAAEISRLQQETTASDNSASTTSSPSPKTVRLTVISEPADANIRIMNIGPRYRPGIELEPGRYDLAVSRRGYNTHRQWHNLAQGDQQLRIVLKRATARRTKRTEASNPTGGNSRTQSPPANRGQRAALTAEIAELRKQLKRLERVQSHNNTLEGCAASPVCMKAQREATLVTAKIRVLNRKLQALE